MWKLTGWPFKVKLEAQWPVVELSHPTKARQWWQSKQCIVLPNCFYNVRSSLALFEDPNRSWPNKLHGLEYAESHLFRCIWCLSSACFERKPESPTGLWFLSRFWSGLGLIWTTRPLIMLLVTEQSLRLPLPLAPDGLRSTQGSTPWLPCWGLIVHDFQLRYGNFIPRSMLAPLNNDIIALQYRKFNHLARTNHELVMTRFILASAPPLEMPPGLTLPDFQPCQRTSSWFLVGIGRFDTGGYIYIYMECHWY